MKTKIKSHGHKVTDSYDKKIPKFDFNHTCLAVLAWILLLKECKLLSCKYIEKKGVRYIHDNLSYFSYTSNESDEEYLSG